MCVARSAVILARLVASMLLAGSLAVSASAQTSQTITFGVLANKTYGAAPSL
jgi:hypothetical protein